MALTRPFQYLSKLIPIPTNYIPMLGKLGKVTTTKPIRLIGYQCQNEVEKVERSKKAPFLGSDRCIRWLPRQRRGNPMTGARSGRWPKIGDGENLGALGFFWKNGKVFLELKHFLNTDGAIQITSGRAATGGVVRDGFGNWVMGYNRFLGNYLIFDSELLDILGDLKLIQRKDHSNVIIHLDSLEVVKVINDNISKSSTSALIRRIHRILSQENQWILRYILKEENQCTDYLAKLAFGREEDLQLVEVP
ncbi:hypothetical protein J1N35_009773 [Gossypium stocksii]|uniref:RNase H type-1 domain-containing protein n=1 Tax=Gossypium stocksii TaxID=47602 RepID=A0A9D4ABZ7_9ROSI|nr:hypothetical protein J1N35_009773 [Gossypium stocksii]